jgi:L,D-transpeptidase-like protein
MAAGYDFMRPRGKLMKRIVAYIFSASLLLCWGLFPASVWALPEDGAAQSVGEGAPIEAPTQPPVTEPLSLRLNIPAARLDLYRQDQFVKSYKVAVGQKANPTPLRDYTISMIIWNPWWIPPDSEWAKDAEKTPPGAGNPLGVVKMIMEEGVRIHGTNQSSSIGRAVSHACIRMFNKDAKELAWEIQSRYSEKADPTLLDTYQHHRSTAYYVPLFASVPVAVEYLQVERKEDQLLLHPNFYGMEGFSEQLAEALKDHPEVDLNKALIKKLNKMRAGKSVEVSVAQVLEWAQQVESKGSKEKSPGDKDASQPLNSHAAQALTVN